MANSFTLARPYAKAVFDIAERSDLLDSWSDFLKAVNDVFPDLMLVVFGASGRRGVLSLLDFRSIFSEQQVFFLKLLLSRGRFRYFPAICSIFHEMLYQRNAITPVVAKSGLDLSPEDISSITAFLEKMLSSKVDVRFDIDSRIIGGCVFHIHDDCYDASVLGRLEKLEGALGV
ncbi:MULTISPECIES: ATP synthase F1 subunit delta [Candidatus Ichthyocystis]|nr:MULTISPECIES: ATP synthase F1 subunit delta [Ichthyocystis]